MIELGADFTANGLASDADILVVEQLLGFSLPADYRQTLILTNGGEGFVGEHYFVLWPAQDLHRFNVEYEFAKYAPGLVAFGGDGGGEGFAYDTRSPSLPIVMIGFIGMEPVVVADSFADLVSKMRSQSESLLSGK